MDPLQNQKWLITWRASSPWRARSWKCIVDEWSKRMLTQIEQQTSRGWQSSATAWSRQAYEASRSSRHTHTVINCGIQWPPRVLWLSTSDKEWWLNRSDEDKLGTLLELSGKKKKYCLVWKILFHTLRKDTGMGRTEKNPSIHRALSRQYLHMCGGI